MRRTIDADLYARTGARSTTSSGSLGGQRQSRRSESGTQTNPSPAATAAQSDRDRLCRRSSPGTTTHEADRSAHCLSFAGQRTGLAFLSGQRPEIPRTCRSGEHGSPSTRNRPVGLHERIAAKGIERIAGGHDGITCDGLLTPICTALYCSLEMAMNRTGRKEAEEARSQLPELLDAAQKGRSTIITKHGRPVAALVPVDDAAHRSAPRWLLPLKGSGRGLWGSSSARTLRVLRDEWSR